MNLIGSARTLRMIVASLALIGVMGCQEATDPDQAFLLRLPADNMSATSVAVINAEPGRTSVTPFEWEPAPGARSYRIAFWQSESREAMNLLEADFSSPSFTIPVEDPQIIELPYNASDPDDTRVIPVVRYELVHDDLEKALEEAGLPINVLGFYVWSVYAERGKKEWRSPKLHRIILRRLHI